MSNSVILVSDRTNSNYYCTFSDKYSSCLGPPLGVVQEQSLRPLGLPAQSDGVAARHHNLVISVSWVLRSIKNTIAPPHPRTRHSAGTPLCQLFDRWQRSRQASPQELSPVVTKTLNIQLSNLYHDIEMKASSLVSLYSFLNKHMKLF